MIILLNFKYLNILLNSNIFDLYKYFIFDFDGIIKESVDSKKKLTLNYLLNINSLSIQLRVIIYKMED